jgi:hypothetical protein
MKTKDIFLVCKEAGKTYILDNVAVVVRLGEMKFGETLLGEMRFGKT